MTAERFKNTWQPPIDSYERVCFNLDLKELEQQIRAEAEQEHAKMCESCIHKVSKEDIDAIRIDALDEYHKEMQEIIEGNEEFTDWQKHEILYCNDLVLEELKG